MNVYQRMVEDFHEAMDLPVGDPHWAQISRPLLRAELIREESDETCAALERGDLVETIDGLCDVVYVAYGAAVEFGLVLSVQEFGAGDRPSGLRYPRLFSRMLLRRADDAILSILDTYGPYTVAVQSRLQDLICLCHSIATQCGIHLRPFFEEVHRVNLTKANGPVRADGKRLKGPDYKPPRIREMLTERGWVSGAEETTP